MKKVVKISYEWNNKELDTFKMLSEFIKDFKKVCPSSECMFCPLGEFCGYNAEGIKERLEVFLEENL